MTLQRDKQKLVILDICFGLGYNTLATLYNIKENDLTTQVEILSPEFDDSLVRSLERFEYPQEFAFLRPIIRALSQNFYYRDQQFSIEILRGDARLSIPAIEQTIDIVYQDPFSPKHNPLLWTREYFADIRQIVAEDAVLTTYSIAASVRLALYENGFNVFLYEPQMARRSTVASPLMLEELTYIDMELKKERNPTARSLRDVGYL